MHVGHMTSGFTQILLTALSGAHAEITELIKNAKCKATKQERQQG